MTKLKWVFAFCLIMMLVAVPLLGACEEEVSPPADGDGVTPPSNGEEEGPVYGGTLRIIMGGEATSMFPAELIGPPDYYSTVPAIETLLYLDAEGVPQPFLVESYEEDPDNLAIYLYLIEGIKFQDGTDFNAEAVKWNMEQLMESPLSGSSFVAVSSVDVVGDYTVRLNFDWWDNQVTKYLSGYGMVSQAAYEEHDIDWMRKNPVGTGPFKLVSWQRDTQKVYERWDGYWQEGKPYLDRIEVNIIADPMVQLASFLAGENDILFNLNPTDAYTMKDNPDVSIASSPCGLTYVLLPDSANPDSPFSDLLVRQAMSYAINRQAIADTVLRGFGEVLYQLSTPTSWSYNPDIVGYPYDPDKARELLEDAGHGDGFSTVIWYKAEQLSQDLYTAVQADLAAVGIEAELQSLSSGAFDDTYFATGWIGGVLGAPCYAGPNIGFLATWFWNADSCVPSFGVSTIHPDDLNEACNQFAAATDFESKQSLAREFQSVLFDKYCLETIVCFLPFMVAKSSKLHDEYSCVMAYDTPYTFADAWMEE